MAEEEAEQQPPMNHVQMTHICNACDEDCETACKDGTCRLNPKRLSTSKPDPFL